MKMARLLDVIREVASAAKHELLAQLNAPGLKEELDDLRQRYRERGEQLDLERVEYEKNKRGYEATLAHTHELVDAVAKQRDEARAEVERLRRPWVAVQCKPDGLQYNIARERPHNGESFFSDGRPMPTYDHFANGGFTKEQAERIVARMNDDLQGWGPSPLEAVIPLQLKGAAK